MADRLQPQEREKVKRLVVSLKERSGCRRWADFARLAQVSEYSLAEWRSGRGTPSAYSLLRMLAAVHALTDDLELAPPSPTDLAEELVRRLDAGEKVPAKDLERVAASVEKAAAAYLRLADRLRQGEKRARQ